MMIAGDCVIFSMFGYSKGFNFFPEEVSFLGVSLKWSILSSWYQQIYNYKKADAEKRQKSAKIQQIIDHVNIEVRATHQKLKESDSLLLYKTLAMNAAQEKLREHQQQYQQRRILLQDLLKAKAEFATSTYERSQARITYWRTLADLNYLLGRD